MSWQHYIFYNIIFSSYKRVFRYSYIFFFIFGIYLFLTSICLWICHHVDFSTLWIIHSLASYHGGLFYGLCILFRLIYKVVYLDIPSRDFSSVISSAFIKNKTLL